MWLVGWGGRMLPIDNRPCHCRLWMLIGFLAARRLDSSFSRNPDATSSQPIAPGSIRPSTLSTTASKPSHNLRPAIPQYPSPRIPSAPIPVAYTLPKCSLHQHSAAPKRSRRWPPALSQPHNGRRSRVCKSLGVLLQSQS
jgi:hypothetical protein